MPQCPECGAAQRENWTCEDDFHQMLFWENEHPALGEVHHLAVLCYHIQHPSLYAPEGLKNAIQLLTEFVEGGVTPQRVRRERCASVDSGNRTWKIKASENSHAIYPDPIQWRITAADVVAAGVDHYCDQVRRWAQFTCATLKELK